MGIDLENHIPQLIDLKLAQAGAQHLHWLMGIPSLAGPVGDAPAEVMGDIVRQLRLLILGKDQHLYVDALLVNLVQHHRGKDGVDNRIDHGGHTEQKPAQAVEQGIEDNIEPADGEVAAPLGQAQSHNIQTTAAAPAGEHEAAAHPGENPAHQAVGEDVLHHRRGQGGDQAEKEGAGGGADRKSVV